MSVTLAPSTPAAPSARRPHPARRLAVAVAAAVMANAVVTTATDQILHVLDVYPPWGQPMFDPGDNLLALGYRTVYTVLGGYLAAALAARFTARRSGRPATSDAGGAPLRDAPTRDAPMRAALAFGLIGLVLSAAGAAVTITRYDLGPDWYPLLLAAVALPAAWLGGALHRRGGRASDRSHAFARVRTR